MRRNAAELPRETAEQAQNMRRVMADQIQALSELTEIVARSGRSLDLSLPQAAPAYETRPIPATSAPQAAERPPERQVEREIERPAEPTPVAEAPRASQPSRQPEPLRPSLPAEPIVSPQSRVPAQPRLEPPRPAPLPAAARTGAKSQQQGWLSDLLARASVEEQREPAPPPARSNGGAPNGSAPLEAISTDIARMIDTGAANEAWERYRRGDDDAFDDTIYTGRGAQTFEEIGRRYKADGDFRTTVDRYVQEFERLLSQIQHDDPDDRMLRGYLGSDSGKVYTMLAHASGRLS